MRKSKPLIAGRVSVFGNRPVIRLLDDGVMVVPIPSDQRASADVEMKEYINRHKQKCQFSHK
ncbi:hypothetical protein [Paenibacillus periandrae]|uniref:hypothetical protein n=1 Tax=Paenibacillus periandrae TaxID=1761741 RepID=UPI001F092597|nr:hypothetical protein [Paenibacillus periandrae]